MKAVVVRECSAHPDLPLTNIRMWPREEKTKPAFLEITVRTETGTFDLEAGIRRIGDDLLVAVWGGERPHIGAVAVAQSRPSLRNPEARSATASVICFPAHKEDEMAKAISQVLAAALDTKVVVTAGMHWDNLGEEDIRKVIQNGETIVDLILEALLVPPPRHEDSRQNC